MLPSSMRWPLSALERMGTGVDRLLSGIDLGTKINRKGCVHSHSPSAITSAQRYPPPERLVTLFSIALSSKNNSKKCELLPLFLFE